MIVITVLYPQPAEGVVRFDFDYYENRHMASVRERLGGSGLVSARALRGFPNPDGSRAPFVAIALLEFESMAAVQASMGSAGAEIQNDVPNFTDLSPIMQVNEVVRA